MKGGGGRGREEASREEVTREEVKLGRRLLWRVIRERLLVFVYCNHRYRDIDIWYCTVYEGNGSVIFERSLKMGLQ